MINIIIGFIVGMFFFGILAWILMPKMMLADHTSRFDSVEATCEKLRASIEAHGWYCPNIRDMNKTMAKHGVQMEKPVRIIELCNAKYAKSVLTTNPEISTMMPCAWGVYEGADQKIHISGMNMGLMAKMFGGNIAKVMGASVSRDEKAILQDVVVH